MAAKQIARPKGMRKKIHRGKGSYATYRAACMFLVNKKRKLLHQLKLQPSNMQVRHALDKLDYTTIPRHGRSLPA